MVAFHKDLYWNVRLDHDNKHFVYIWRYQPTDGCTEHVSQAGVKVYEKRLRIQAVKIIDIKFGAIVNWITFNDARPKDEDHIQVGTTLERIARDSQFEPIHDERGRVIYWTTARRYDECQDFFVAITTYKSRYFVHDDSTAIAHEKTRISKEEWIKQYHQINDELNPSTLIPAAEDNR